MRRIVRSSLRFRWLVLFLATATLALGFVQIPETKVDVFPEFAPLRIEIQTIALGNSSNEVEQLITVPIEDQLNGIEGLTDLRSKSVAQLSAIVMFFEAGTDELRARQLVAERLSQITATLPTWASPPFMMPALSATSRIMKIGMTSGRGEPHRHVRAGLLEGPRPAAPRARGRPGGDLGRAAAAAPCPGRPGEAGRARRHPAGGDERLGRRARRGPAALLRRRRGRHRRIRGEREPAAQCPTRATDRRRRGPRPGAGAGTGRQDPAARRPGRGQGGPRPADRRRRGERRARAVAGGPEVPRGEHGRGDQGRRGGHGGDGSRTAGHRGATPRSSDRRPSSSSRSTTSPGRSCSASCSWP